MLSDFEKKVGITAILARCRQAMRRAGLSQAETDAFMAEATAGN